MIKIILREALKDVYPEKIYKRNDKAEFSEALLALMNSIDILKLWEKSSFLNEKLINEELLRELLIKYEQQNMNTDDISMLWHLSSMALWFEEQKIKET